jgi:transposase
MRYDSRMFIRKTTTRNGKTGEAYFTHRLVEAMRVGNSVKQVTVLNIGSHFDVPREQWADLAARIDEILHNQSRLLNDDFPEALEILAQRYAAQLIARRSKDEGSGDAPVATMERFHEVDITTLEMVRPRTVGAECLALSGLRQLGLDRKLNELGFSKPQIAAAIGNVVGRIVAPNSERATYKWLQNSTALGELIDYNYEGMDLQQLYRSADLLLKHREELEDFLFQSAKDLFGIVETITLFDLTNTYFEGDAEGIEKAHNGRSKEKRSDCPLVTLGMVLDVSGFPKRTQVFKGNVSEASVLKTMLEGLKATTGSVVVMDAGIATEANLTWLKEQDYHYVVVSRKRERQFDPEQATIVLTAGQKPVHVQRVQEPDSDEVLLYCHSEARAEKDKAIDTTKAERFEAGLQKIADGLTTKRGAKDADKLNQRIGRLKERYARAAQHYTIDLVFEKTEEADEKDSKPKKAKTGKKAEKGHKVTAITWRKTPKPGSAATHPGVYCLRTTLTEPDNEALWRIYSMLTNLEAVFRSLKTDLGLRPVYHHNGNRVEGHMFISVLAYYIVHTLRRQLKANGVNDSWETLRATLSTQVRITVTLQRRDGRVIHVRKASRPEPGHQRIYDALKLPGYPGGTQQTLV